MTIGHVAEPDYKVHVVVSGTRKSSWVHSAEGLSCKPLEFIHCVHRGAIVSV